MGKKKPSGGVIKRSGNVFACSWKKGGKYWTSQQFQYKLSNTGWITLAVGANTTSKSFSVNMNNYCPFTTKFLTSVGFRVRGKKDSFHSGWETKWFKLSAPSAPSVSGTLDSELDNVTLFQWSANAPSEGGNVFARTEYKSTITTESAVPSYGNSSHAGSSGSWNIVEDNSINDGKSHTRWVAVRSRGCAGNSEWKVAKHVYAKPKQSFNVSASVDKTNGYLCSVKYQTTSTSQNPIDNIEVQYCITKPDRGLNCPSGVSWSVGSKAAYRDGTDLARFYIDDTLSDDECLFVRVNTKHDHDTNTTYGQAVLADVGHLAKPSNIEITPDSTHHTATIEADNESDIVDSFLAIVYQPSSRTEDAYVVGVMPHGYSTITVTCPDWSGEDGYSFGIYSVVGTYERSTDSQGLPRYNVLPYSGKPVMVSETEWWTSGDVPSMPYNVTVSETGTVGKVRISWSNDWKDSTGAELTWSENRDAWESTDEPDDYTIKNPMATSWIITGLKTGTWYFRVRMINENGDNTVYSPYSETIPFVISSVPTTPVLSLGSNAVTIEQDVSVSWVYTVIDDAVQESAELFEIIDITNRDQDYIASPDTEVKALTVYYTRSGAGTEQSPYVYTSVANPIGNPSTSGYYQKNFRSLRTTTTEQHTAVNPVEAGWEAGEQHDLVVRIDYGSGVASSWSNVVPLAIAPVLTCQIASTSLQNVLVPLDEDAGTTTTDYSLTELPLEITVTGAGTSNMTNVVVERAQSYFALRPDQSEFHGYEGETVCMIQNQIGEGTISFGLDDLLMQFDDGAQYRIIAETRDEYGQVATAEPVTFTVHWAHQAIMPIADVGIDDQNNVACIIPKAPVGALETDSCDIYRLSADKPELILQNVPFASSFLDSYIDPYPALGKKGGHRIVYKTANGDYITESNEFAWLDLGVDDGDTVDLDRTIIDFNGEQIVLNYNIDLSNQWEKDFVETRYLGGSVQGDWNPAIGRKGTVTAVTITLTDQDTIDAMRRLATYAGRCHIRTQDGSSFTADIQVSEERKHDTKRTIVSYTLAITRVDPEELDGITFADYMSRYDVAIDYLYQIIPTGHLEETSENGTSGGRTFEIDENLHLTMTEQDTAVEDISFSMENGRLVVTYGD